TVLGNVEAARYWRTKRRSTAQTVVPRFSYAPKGIRTPVLALKGPRPSPLDDGGLTGRILTYPAPSFNFSLGGTGCENASLNPSPSLLAGRGWRTARPAAGGGVQLFPRLNRRAALMPARHLPGGVRHAQQPPRVRPDELHADGQLIPREAARQRERRVAAETERVGEAQQRLRRPHPLAALDLVRGERGGRHRQHVRLRLEQRAELPPPCLPGLERQRVVRGAVRRTDLQPLAHIPPEPLRLLRQPLALVGRRIPQADDTRRPQHVLDARQAHVHQCHAQPGELLRGGAHRVHDVELRLLPEERVGRDAQAQPAHRFRQPLDVPGGWATVDGVHQQGGVV